MQIQQKENGQRGMFYVQPEGEEILAELVYSRKGENRLVLEHTEVDERLRGKNVGYQLIQTAVEYARENQMKILPLCSFAAAVFGKKPELADVLDR